MERDSGRKRFGVPTDRCCLNTMGTGRDSPPGVTCSWELGQGPGLPGLPGLGGAELRVPHVGPHGCVGWGLHGGCYGRTGTAKFSCRGGGQGTREWLWGVCLGPRAGRSPQFKLSMLYAGDTWLEETEETSVLLWDTAEEVSSSPKGFLPQQIVVIMQLRNWGGDRNEDGGTGGPAGMCCRTRGLWMD